MVMKRLTINFTLESGKNLFIEKVLHFRLNVFQWGKEKKTNVKSGERYIKRIGSEAETISFCFSF